MTLSGEAGSVPRQDFRIAQIVFPISARQTSLIEPPLTSSTPTKYCVSPNIFPPSPPRASYRASYRTPGECAIRRLYQANDTLYWRPWLRIGEQTTLASIEQDRNRPVASNALKPVQARAGPALSIDLPPSYGSSMWRRLRHPIGKDSACQTRSYHEQVHCSARERQDGRDNVAPAGVPTSHQQKSAFGRNSDC